jgi:hypothetical protein
MKLNINTTLILLGISLVISAGCVQKTDLPVKDTILTCKNAATGIIEFKSEPMYRIFMQENGSFSMYEGYDYGSPEIYYKPADNSSCFTTKISQES